VSRLELPPVRKVASLISLSTSDWLAGKPCPLSMTLKLSEGGVGVVRALGVVGSVQGVHLVELVEDDHEELARLEEGSSEPITRPISGLHAQKVLVLVQLVDDLLAEVPLVDEMGWIDTVLHVDVDRDDVREEDVKQRDEGAQNGGLANPAAGVGTGRCMSSSGLRDRRRWQV